MLRDFFIRLKSGTEHLNYGRHVIEAWGGDHIRARAESDPARTEFRLLDIGCGHGTDLLNIRESLQQNPPPGGKSPVLKLEGIENFSDYAKECRSQGIKISARDIERDRFPGKNGSFDIIIANQVLEHVKEIFWIFAEVARLLRPGGVFIAGVPNLASLHNRLLLLFGRQPTAQQSLSAHVRGFTRPDFKHFAETGDFFRLRDFRGSNFYPFGASISRPLSRAFPGAAWGIFFLLERTERAGSFLECLEGDENFLETPFYGSPQNPAR